MNWTSNSPAHYRNYSTVRVTTTSHRSAGQWSRHSSAGLWSCKPGLPMAFTGRWWSCTLGSSRMLPAKTLSVVPDLPGSWRELSIDKLHVGSDQIAVSVQRAGINYITTVSAPAGWSLTIGYTLPANRRAFKSALAGV